MFLKDVRQTHSENTVFLKKNVLLEGPGKPLEALGGPRSWDSVFWQPLGPSWARRRGAQDALGGVLAVLGPSAGASGRLLEASWPSWAPLRGRLGGSWRRLGRLGAVLGPSGGAVLGALGVVLAVLKKRAKHWRVGHF